MNPEMIRCLAVRVVNTLTQITGELRNVVNAIETPEAPKPEQFCQKIPHWIWVEDRLPTQNERVLIYIPSSDTTQASIRLARYSSWMVPAYAITHWMPLPAPPF